jgi:hypothetical protein
MSNKGWNVRYFFKIPVIIALVIRLDIYGGSKPVVGYLRLINS